MEIGVYWMIYIATFYSHFTAMVFQKAVKEKGFCSKLMPVPRYLSSSCGTCVQFETEAADLSDLFRYDGIEKIFFIEGEGKATEIYVSACT